MSISEKTADNLQRSLGQPSNPVEKIGLLVLGLAVGYLLPYFLSHLLVRAVRLAVADATPWMTTIVVFSYLVCLLVARFLWRRRYFAIGLIIPAAIQLLAFVFAIGL